jgi:hypothetical protein
LLNSKLHGTKEEESKSSLPKHEAQELTREVKELALKSGANLVGIVSTEAIDALPPIYVGWTIQKHTQKTTETMPDAKSIILNRLPRLG